MLWIPDGLGCNLAQSLKLKTREWWICYFILLMLCIFIALNWILFCIVTKTSCLISCISRLDLVVGFDLWCLTSLSIIFQLLLEETRVPGENHRPVTSHWQNVVSSTRRHERSSIWKFFVLIIYTTDDDHDNITARKLIH